MEMLDSKDIIGKRRPVHVPVRTGPQKKRSELLNQQVARLIYDLRTRAGLTQQELATRIGTTQSAIARLEAKNYRGHSLTMLQRIAAAVNGRIEVRFSPE